MRARALFVSRYCIYAAWCRTEHKGITNFGENKKFALNIGYLVNIRPSLILYLHISLSHEKKPKITLKRYVGDHGAPVPNLIEIEGIGDFHPDICYPFAA